MSDDDKIVPLQGARAAILNAPQVPTAANDQPVMDVADPGWRRDGPEAPSFDEQGYESSHPYGWRQEEGRLGYGPYGDDGLPAAFPVDPLGVMGMSYHFVDRLGQVVSVKSDKLNRSQIMHLVGGDETLLRLMYPKWKVVKTKVRETLPSGKTGIREVEDWIIQGARWEDISADLMQACTKAGLIDVNAVVRGVGCWRHDDYLVINTGKRLLVRPKAKAASGKAEATGRRKGLVYVAGPALPQPAETARFDADAPIHELKRLLASWQFARADIDAHLMLGWIGAALMGGALNWRPMVWVVGQRGSGKSTLITLIDRVLRDWLLQSNDATQAGIRQTIGHSSRAVGLDEQESDSSTQGQLSKMIALVRGAASGGKAYRGGADHGATSFTIRSAFLMGSIRMPALTAQDRSRITVLELNRLPQGAGEPNLDPGLLASAGRWILRRIVDTWPDWDGLLTSWRADLAAAGHDARACDQLGTLLAMADMLTAAEPMEPAVRAVYCSELRPANLIDTRDEVEDHLKLFSHLFGTQAPIHSGGSKPTIGRLISEALDPSSDELNRGPRLRDLNLVGMAIVEPTQAKHKQAFYAYHDANKDETADPLGPCLFIANQHPALETALRGTQWETKSGLTGVWVQDVRRVPNCPSGRPQVFPHQMRFGLEGGKRGYLIRLKALGIDPLARGDVDDE